MKRTSRQKPFSVTIPRTPMGFPWKLLKALTGDLSASLQDIMISDLERLWIDDLFQSINGAIRRKSIDDVLTVCATASTQCISGVIGMQVGLRAHVFFCIAQIRSLLKKYPFAGGKEARDKAIAKFRETETSCALFNNENYAAVEKLSETHPDFYDIIPEIRADILTLLGDFPNIDCLFGQAKHGPGVSLGNLYKKGKCTTFYKLSNLPYSVTHNALGYAKSAILSDPRWIGALDDWYRNKHSVPIGSPISMEHFWNEVFQIEESSRLTTVPKSYDIDRTIAIEPVLNVYLQLGVDGIFRGKLKKRWGIDINDQTLNQEYARQGSLNGNLATLDLSSASDLISLKVCEMLLPPAWYGLLLDLRCSSTSIEGEVVPLSKISSMGNGYTFALETLIFAAIARWSKNYDNSIVSVYGDDIIIDTHHVPMLVQGLNLFGFKVNEEKSFSSGPFRESCGRDYYSGFNVRPLFLKKVIKNLPDLLYVYNSFFLLERTLEWTWDVKFTRTLSFVRKYLPDHFCERAFGPPSETLDTYFFDESRKNRLTKHGYRLGLALKCRAKVYKTKYRDFYFQKLMVALKQTNSKTALEMTPSGEYRWDKKRMTLGLGNAFQVTRRARVSYFLTRRKVW